MKEKIVFAKGEIIDEIEKNKKYYIKTEIYAESIAGINKFKTGGFISIEDVTNKKMKLIEQYGRF